MTSTEFTTTEIKAHDAATYEMIIEKARTERSLEWDLHKLHEEAGDQKVYPIVNGRRGSYSSARWGMTDQEAFDAVRALAADPKTLYLERHPNSGGDDSFFAYIGQKAQEVADKVIATQDKIKSLAASIRAQEEVYVDQGGWSRFEMVPGGHIHNRNATCHTLRPTTQVAWIPELSGDDEATAVATYGPALCTHCYKGAPVEWVQQAKVQKNADGNVATLAEAQVIADEKAAAKAAREAKKAAKEARALARAAR